MRPLRDERAEQVFTPEQVAALVPYGRELGLQAGEFLFDETATVDSFYVVLEGEVGISRLDGAEEISLDTHGTGEFTGGLAVLTGRTSIHRARAAGSSRILARKRFSHPANKPSGRIAVRTSGLRAGLYIVRLRAKSGRATRTRVFALRVR